MTFEMELSPRNSCRNTYRLAASSMCLAIIARGPSWLPNTTPTLSRQVSPSATGEARKEIKFPPDTLVVGDILLITENDYEALCSAGGDTVIFNGELCEVTLGATSSTWNLSQIAMGSGASACH